MQALMLAAGMGRRMGKHTEACTKCMIEVGGRTLLSRTVEALQEAGIRKFVMVVGWEADKLVSYIRNTFTEMEFEFVYNHDYATTNNIYSLHMAREQLARDDTILLESDLVYDKGVLRQIAACPYENLVAVAKYQQWMDGTVVTLDHSGMIHEFIDKKNFLYQNADGYYKTVNIYRFSKEFSRNQYLPFLDAYITAYGKNQYYEMVLKAIAHIAQAQLQAFVLENIDWYEVDDVQDLDIANTMFAGEGEKLQAYEGHFGGYWRFPGVKDFCYLVNPYFPPKQMLDQMKYFYDPLLTQYPSGMGVQRLLASKMFQVDEEYLLVGNGAAELINALGRLCSGKLAVSVPAFHEYIRCFRDCEIISLPTEDNGFCLDKGQLIQAAKDADILAIINPDNPSGSFLNQAELMEILDHCRENGTRCIVDESFIDFAQPKLRYTLLQDGLLEYYPNLVVLKSISKSYGVPGLRLGILASADRQLVQQVREYLSIWNINSFAEYFLQIFSLHAAGYRASCDKISEQRSLLEQRLGSIAYLEVFPSQANYIMCRVKPPYRSKELATQLLLKHKLLIKDLSLKTGFSGGQYIRVAVKDEMENNCLYEGLKALEQKEDLI